MRTVGIIGLGLIGGSLALDIKRRGFAGRTLGVEKDPTAAEAARTLALVDEVVDFDTLMGQADIIVVAVPVGTAVKLMKDILSKIGDHQIVIDVCSTKEPICLETELHPRRSRYVSTHPMAGTEYSGPWAAQPGLFDGRACIFCNTEESDPEAVAVVKEMYDTLGMRILFMQAAQHDVHTAYVSHISHVTSFALALTVLDKEKDESHIFDLASGGFSSTVRLAKSNADMWVPILTQNRNNILEAMDTYIEKMKTFREAVASRDEDKIRELIAEANKIKKILR